MAEQAGESRAPCYIWFLFSRRDVLEYLFQGVILQISIGLRMINKRGQGCVAGPTYLCRCQFIGQVPNTLSSIDDVIGLFFHPILCAAETRDHPLPTPFSYSTLCATVILPQWRAHNNIVAAYKNSVY